MMKTVEIELKKAFGPNIACETMLVFCVQNPKTFPKKFIVKDSRRVIFTDPVAEGR